MTGGYLADVIIYVGSCTEATDNIQCGSMVTVAEAALGSAQSVYRACPENTYGQYVHIVDTTSGSVQTNLCEVIVHGKARKWA